MRDTGTERREPLRHRGCGVRRRRLGAGAGEGPGCQAESRPTCPPALSLRAREVRCTPGSVTWAVRTPRRRAGPDRTGPDWTLPLPTAALERPPGAELPPPPLPPACG